MNKLRQAAESRRLAEKRAIQQENRERLQDSNIAVRLNPPPRESDFLSRKYTDKRGQTRVGAPTHYTHFVKTEPRGKYQSLKEAPGRDLRHKRRKAFKRFITSARRAGNGAWVDRDEEKVWTRLGESTLEWLRGQYLSDMPSSDW